MAELIASRARYLADPDRILLEQIYLRAVSVNQLALTAGCSAKTMRSRIRALVARVLDPAFPVVILLRPQWPRHYADLASMLFIEGLSCRAAADRTGRSYVATLHTRNAILTLIEAECARGGSKRSGAPA